MSGRNLRCGNNRNVLDRRLPSEGAAAPGVLVINPRLINRMPEKVRLFVFHHECGHHHIGASELRADSWAVDRGVREGWLDANGLTALHREALAGNLVQVRLLLAHGADTRVRTPSGLTALELAQRVGWPRVVEVLQAA